MGFAFLFLRDFVLIDTCVFMRAGQESSWRDLPKFDVQKRACVRVISHKSIHQAINRIALWCAAKAPLCHGDFHRNDVSSWGEVRGWGGGGWALKRGALPHRPEDVGTSAHRAPAPRNTQLGLETSHFPVVAIDRVCWWHSLWHRLANWPWPSSRLLARGAPPRTADSNTNRGPHPFAADSTRIQICLSN